MHIKSKRLMMLSLGNIIEWYDFSLYIYFSIDIARTFFPHQDVATSYLLALSTFFLGSITRPLGALLLGWLGDRYHQGRVINLAIVMMSLSTFLVALLPAYQSIGFAAPLLLMVLRMVQGLSAGGQFPGLITLAIKTFSNNRGLAVGLVFSVSSLGFLLASLIAFVMATLMPSNLLHNAFTWRLPFALSGLFFLLYRYFNHQYNQYSDDSQAPVAKQSHVFFSLLRQWRTLVAISLLTMVAASFYYLIFTYLVNYAILHLGLDVKKAFLLNSLSLLFACILYPFFGRLADKVGYYSIFMISASLLLLAIHPLLILFKMKLIIFPLLALLLFTLALTAIQGAISPLFAASFEDEWMATGCALAYSIGNGLSGGAPLLAETLVHYDRFGLSGFMMTLVMLGFLGMWLLRKTTIQKGP